MALGPEQLESLLETIHQDYPEPSSQDISMELQKYWWADRLLGVPKIGTFRPKASQVKWKYEVDYAKNFQVVSLYHRDSSDRVDILEEASQKWGLTTTNYHYDIDEEVFKEGADEIFDYMSAMEAGLWKSQYAGMEDLILGPGPSSSTQKPFPPLSLLSWITSTSDSTTEDNATQGFTGADPVGWGSDGISGLLRSTYEQLKNRAFPYTNVSDLDLVKKVIKSMDFCHFSPPVSRPNIVDESAPRWEMMTTHSRVELLRDLQSSKNDNHGNENAKYGNGTMLRGVEVNWVPAWTNTASTVARDDGIFLGVDWATMAWAENPGRRRRKHKPFQHPEMSNVRVRKMDDAGQLICYNPRGNFRGYCTDTVTETQ